MSEFEDQRAQLTRKLTEITEMRALYLERYGPILRDRTRRVEINRKLRSHDKALLAELAATEKLALVREELAKPAYLVNRPLTDQEFRLWDADCFRRKTLAEEQARLIEQIRELQVTVDIVAALRTELESLLPEDPELAELVEGIQQDFNITQQELYHTEALITAKKETKL